MDETPTPEMMRNARAELACQTCGNNPRGYMGDECPACHGEHRNVATIALLEALTRIKEPAAPTDLMIEAGANVLADYPEFRTGADDVARKVITAALRAGGQQ